MKLGAGRAELLEAIDQLGSIRAAVEQFGMSYRYVWGYLRELEAAAGFPFVERHRGRGTRGTRLTPQTKELLARYGDSNTASTLRRNGRSRTCFGGPDFVLAGVTLWKA